jgi:predicted HTH domain antitoxin
MEILVQIPDDIAERLQAQGVDLPRRLLECLAAESYRAEILTAAEVRRILGFETRLEIDAFLKQERCYLHYTEEDFQQDIETHRRLFNR